MYQDGTSRVGGPLSRPHCARWGPSYLPEKGDRVPPPQIFGPFLMWPNSWMHQDATWYGDRLQPRRLCVRWGPSSPSPKRGKNPQFSAHVYCGQTAGWMKMPLGTEVGLGPGDIVLDGDSAPLPLQKSAQPPSFRPISIVAKWLYVSGYHLVWR